jgi:DNA-binding XRE family transcriptional regulator
MVNSKTSGPVWPTARLIRAARGLAGLDQATLAERANVSRKAVVSVEGDDSGTMDYRRLAVLRKLQVVLENEYEIEFQKPTKSSGPGVRLRTSK